MNKALINTLKIDSFNTSEFRNIYKIVQISHPEDSKISIKGENSLIYSVSYIKSGLFYALIPSNAGKTDIKSILAPNMCLVSDIDVEELNNKHLLSLFLNKNANEDLSFNNLSASLNRIIKSDKEKKVTLSYSINEELLLSCVVKTYSVVNRKTISRFKAKQRRAIEENKLTKYETFNNFVVREIKFKDENYLVNRSISKKKNNLSFFEIDYKEDKVSNMFYLIRGINSKNNGILSLSFDNTTYERILERTRTNKDKFPSLFSKFSKCNVINVIDNCGCTEEMKTLLSGYPFELTFSQELRKDAYNLSIVKKKSVYEELDEEDLYINAIDYIVQNIENNNINESTIKQCLLEFLIKYEAVTNSIHLVDLKGEWRFYCVFNKTPHVLKIKDNVITYFGSFEVENEKYEYLSLNKSYDPKIICNSVGELTILNTDVRLIPDYEQYLNVRGEIIEVNDDKRTNVARSRRNELFGEIIDINKFSFLDKIYYSVGEIGYGMNKKVATSAATKQIIEQGLSINDVINQMEPNIYHVNKYAVYPYIFKLMLEIFRLNGGVIENDD